MCSNQRDDLLLYIASKSMSGIVKPVQIVLVIEEWFTTECFSEGDVLQFCFFTIYFITSIMLNFAD